ncbi:hypothetical protein Tco_0454490 [Tanacetum coccineum]
MQQLQDKAKESCMVSFRLLHSHPKLLSNNDLKGTRTEYGFKCAFVTLFGQDVETFTGTMFLNVDQLVKQLDKDEFHKIRSMAAFKVLETQFQKFIKSRTYLDDEYVIMTRKEYDSRVNERQMQTTEGKVDTSNALNASLVNTESSRIASGEQDTSSRSGNDAHTDDADIRPIYDEEPMAEVHTTAGIIVFATGQQHTEQPKFNNEGVFASQVDVNNDLSKPVTTHYFTKEKESAVVKPHHVIASSESKNSSKNMPRFSSNDMVPNHYLDEARKKTQEKGRNSRPSVMPSARSQSTSINVQEEQNCDLSAGTPFNLKKERIKACIKGNVISGRPRLHGTTLIQEISARPKSWGIRCLLTS